MKNREIMLAMGSLAISGSLLPMIHTLNHNHKITQQKKEILKVLKSASNLNKIYLTETKKNQHKNLKNLTRDNWNGRETHWWGLGYFFSSTVCQNIVSHIEDGFDVFDAVKASVEGTPLDKYVSAIVAALDLISVAASAIFNDDDGHGIVIDEIYASAVWWYHKQEEYNNIVVSQIAPLT